MHLQYTRYVELLRRFCKVLTVCARCLRPFVHNVAGAMLQPPKLAQKPGGSVARRNRSASQWATQKQYRKGGRRAGGSRVRTARVGNSANPEPDSSRVQPRSASLLLEWRTVGQMDRRTENASKSEPTPDRRCLPRVASPQRTAAVDAPLAHERPKVRRDMLLAAFSTGSLRHLRCTSA